MATLTEEILADSPVGYWKLDETSGTTAADSSGNGHNGTYTNGPLLNQPGFTNGGADPAVDFSGSGLARVAVPADALGLSSVFTVEIWTRAGYGTTRVSLFDPATAGPRLLVGASNGINLAKSGTGGGNIAQATAPSVSPTVWHHVAWVKNGDGDIGIVYIDGQAIAMTLTANLAIPTWAGSLSIGGSANSAHTAFSQHAAIYPTALSAERVLAHFNAGLQGQERMFAAMF